MKGRALMMLTQPARSSLHAVLAIVMGVVIVDQFTKWAVWEWGRGVFTTTLNPGVSFGLVGGLDSRWLTLSLGLFLICFLFFLIKTQLPAVVVGLFIGGALGNFIDRLLLGAVRDWLSLGWGIHNNLADWAIGLSVIVFFAHVIWAEQRKSYNTSHGKVSPPHRAHHSS